jgi:tetratricopeptide (TPR) repeat protein
MSHLQRALESLRKGNAAEAEQIATEGVTEASTKSGAQSHEYAAAEFDLARVLVAMNSLPKAAEALRRAADVPANDGQPQKLRLDYLTNLGEVFTRMGKFQEAVKAHEESLIAREKVYGRGTEGFAIGEAPLAEVLLATNNLEQAEIAIESSLSVLWKAGRPQVVPLAALRAVIRSAKYGDERPLLEPFDALPPQLQVELIKNILGRVQRDNPKWSVYVLEELRERIEDAETHTEALPQVVAAYSNVAAATGAHQERISALEWLRNHFEKISDKNQMLEASLAVALAKDAANDADGAIKEFDATVKRAEPMGHITRARILRNYGVYLSRKNKKEEADKILAEALAASEASGEQEGLGSALVAQGVHFHHTERTDLGKPLLERAVSVLPEKHPDSLYAKGHLTAIEKGEPCGCNDPRTAIARTIAALVQPHLPKGLLTGLTVKSLENLQLEVALSRQPSKEEQELLSRALNQAIAVLRRQQNPQVAGEGDDDEDDAPEGNDKTA